MSFVRNSSAVFLSLIGAANAALAATETWRLEATIIDRPGYSSYFPPFAQPGQSIQIDYVMDLDVPLSSTSNVYDSSILSVTFNGETSTGNPSNGYILAWDGLLALNAGYWSARQNDLVDFISLNNWSSSADAKSGVRSALESMSRSIALGRSELRVDMGNKSFYATPISLSPVPEPQALSLVLPGVLALGFSAAASRKRSAA